MIEALIRRIRGNVEVQGSIATETSKLIFSSLDLEVWVAGEPHDHDVHFADGGMCLVLGHVAGKNSAKSVREQYYRHGAAGVAHLDGHFVVVLYDPTKDEVAIVHDKLGLRHAYYWYRGDDFALSTNLSWLMDVYSRNERAPKPSLSRRGLAYYMAFQYVPTPYTIFEDIHQLQPGTALVSGRDGSVSVRRHVEFPEPGTGKLEGKSEDHGERIADLLSESMAEQLGGGNQVVGAMLSGGYDSSTNVALMTERLGIRPVTFTGTFREAEYDEVEFAATVAAHYGLEHVAIEIKPGLQEILPDVVKSFDSPNADQAVFAEYFVCSAARERGCGAFVSGEGGDEIFGYPRADGEGLDFRNLPQDNDELSRLYFDQTFLAPPGICEELFSCLDEDSTTPYEYLASLYQRFADRSPFERIYYGNWKTWLLDGVYMKDRQVSRHFDLTPIFPFMDTRLMTYASRLSLSQKLSGLKEKEFLASTLVDRVPRQILEREKHKFWLPFAEWFRSEDRDYLRDKLLSSDSFVTEYVGRRVVQRLADEHDTGAADNSRLLWALLFLEVWLQQHASRWIGQRGRSSSTI